MEDKLVLLCTQVNMQEKNVGKDIKVPVSKYVHRSSSTNQSCVQRSQNPCNSEKVYYFGFKFVDLQHKISIVIAASIVFSPTKNGIKSQFPPFLFHPEK